MLDFPKTVEYLKKYLLRQQKEVEKNLTEVEKNDPAFSEGVVESSEPGTDSYIADAHTKIVVLEQKLQRTNSSIREALLKIKTGRYGKCDSCGQQIEIGRLLAMPTAQCCLSCSKKMVK